MSWFLVQFRPLLLSLPAAQDIHLLPVPVPPPLPTLPLPPFPTGVPILPVEFACLQTAWKPVSFRFLSGHWSFVLGTGVVRFRFPGLLVAPMILRNPAVVEFRRMRFREVDVAFAEDLPGDRHGSFDGGLAPAGLIQDLIHLVLWHVLYLFARFTQDIVAELLLGNPELPFS